MGLQKSGTTDKFTFYYQNKDHLGTVRETVTSTGAMKQRVNYYPFGGQLVDTLRVMIWNRDFQQYKYNGKEFDGMYGLNTYDYGARQHYPILARWDRIDPLCEKYYGVSPYAYCANNPVNKIDPDGKEWNYIINEDGSIHITLDDKLTIGENLTEQQIEAYKSAINSTFNSMLSSVEGGNYSGTITFNGNVIEGQVTPNLILGGVADGRIAGQTSCSISVVNLKDSDGKLKSSSVVASDAIHELLHTARLDHPFETTQTTDTELIKNDNMYFSTPNTNPNILYNVMNFPQILIDGQSYRSLGSSQTQTMITKGQVLFLLNEVDLQKKGAGQNFYDEYWMSFPGKKVK